MNIRFVLTTILLILFSASSFAAETFPVTARLFIGASKVSPGNLNQEMAAQSLAEMNSVTLMGVEATYAALKHVEFGLRFTRRYDKREELAANPSTDFYGELEQNSVLLLARVPFLKSKIFRGDVFAGIGGSNTTFKIQSATQNGELTRKKGGDWVATPFASAGASIGIGYKRFYFVVEGGYETNKVDKFDRSGTINSNIDNIDLSGGYFTIGLLFDGVKATK